MKRLITWSIFLLAAAFLSAGCGEFEFGVENRLTSGRPEVTTVVVTATQQLADNMVLVTVTPSAGAETAVSTETAVPTEPAAETEAPSPTASPTETPSPTASPTAAATARPILPTATLAPAQIHEFSASPLTVSPGGSVTASWNAEGATALLCLRFAGGYTDNCYDVPVSGSQTLLIKEHFREDIILDLHLTNAAGQEVFTSIYISLTCPEDFWFFDDPPQGCPGAEPVDTAAAAEYFENGWMLWIGETDTIYALYEPSRTYSVFYSGFGDPDDPAAENSGYNPPDGYFVPKRGFGLVWGLYIYVREMLGWALAPEFGYDTTYQPGADPYNGRVYVLDPDGRIVVLDTYFLTWFYR